MIQGGFGSSLLEKVNELDLDTSVLRIGWPDNFVEHGSSVSQLRLENELDDPAILEKIGNRIRKKFSIQNENSVFTSN